MSLLNFAFLLFLNCTAALAAEKTTPVKVALDWVPNTNHTGLYVAAHEKFFSSQSLQVSFIQPTQSTTTQLVASGSVAFGISYLTDVLKARDQGMPVVSIAAIVQENTSCFAWRESTGIKSPKDWEGKRFGGWGSDEETATLKYIMEKNKADFSKLKIVTTGMGEFIPSTEKNADIMWIYSGWDAVRAKLLNIKLGMTCLREYGLPLNHHSPVIITSEKLIRENPNLIRRFLAATTKGYELSSKDPERASKDLLKEVPELDAKLIRASNGVLAKEFSKGAPQWGIQKKEAWIEYALWLASQKIIRKPELASKAFTNDFLPKH